MKLRALVVEDEWATRNHLVELLQASGVTDVVGAVATGEDALQVLESPRTDDAIDVAFMDVQLVGSERDDEGLEIVRKHARRAGAPLFVLTTAFAQHALEAFDLGVADYLLKPFTQARVSTCLERLRARRPALAASAPASPPRIVARRKRALVFLRLEEIWAFEAAERLAYVHTTRGRFDIDLSLFAVELSFGRTLMRVHRSWLVNCDHVRELEGAGSEMQILVGSGTGADGGVRVPVARDRAAAVREALLGNTMGTRPR